MSERLALELTDIACMLGRARAVNARRANVHVYPFQIRSRSRPSRFLFLGAAGHVIRIFLDMNVTSPEYLSG